MPPKKDGLKKKAAPAVSPAPAMQVVQAPAVAPAADEALPPPASGAQAPESSTAQEEGSGAPPTPEKNAPASTPPQAPREPSSPPTPPSPAGGPAAVVSSNRACLSTHLFALAWVSLLFFILCLLFGSPFDDETSSSVCAAGADGNSERACIRADLEPLTARFATKIKAAFLSGEGASAPLTGNLNTSAIIDDISAKKMLNETADAFSFVGTASILAFNKHFWPLLALPIALTIHTLVFMSLCKGIICLCCFSSRNSTDDNSNGSSETASNAATAEEERPSTSAAAAAGKSMKNKAEKDAKSDVGNLEAKTWCGKKFVTLSKSVATRRIVRLLLVSAVGCILNSEASFSPFSFPSSVLFVVLALIFEGALDAIQTQTKPATSGALRAQQQQQATHDEHLISCRFILLLAATIVWHGGVGSTLAAAAARSAPPAIAAAQLHILSEKDKKGEYAACNARLLDVWNDVCDDPTSQTIHGIIVRWTGPGSINISDPCADQTSKFEKALGRPWGAYISGTLGWALSNVALSVDLHAALCSIGGTLHDAIPGDWDNPIIGIVVACFRGPIGIIVWGISQSEFATTFVFNVITAAVLAFSFNKQFVNIGKQGYKGE